MNNNKISLIDTIRESFGRVAYSHKTHEKMIEQIEKKKIFLNRIEISLAAVTASGILTSIAFDDLWIKVLSAIIAALTFSTALYKSNEQFETKITAHRTAANQLWLLRERYVYLISDNTDSHLNESETIVRRDKLLEDLKRVYDFSPQTNSKAYMAAQTALQKNEDLTFSAKEIDALLPSSLKLSGDT